MIKQLHIINYAIIDEINVSFQEGLNIITGETGAGKSILMGAIGMILGARAETTVLKIKDKKCIVEATFSIEKNKAATNYLQQNELDDEGVLIIRREIAVSGKSRAFVNDTPVTLQQLRELASMLVDLHQQFDTLQLGDSDFQRKVVDAIAGNDNLLTTYQISYKNWATAKHNLESLEQKRADFNKEVDFTQYQYNELKELSLVENELEDLDNELQLLSNAEEIKSTLTQSIYALTDSEEPIINALKQLANKLDIFGSNHTQIADIAARLKSVQIELQDVSQEMEHINDSFNLDEQRLQLINDRLSVGYKLLKKHQVETTNELLQIQKELSQKLEQVFNIDSLIEEAKHEEQTHFNAAHNLAEQLNDARKNQSEKIEFSVASKLAQVGMLNALLKVNIIKEKTLNPFGNNVIEFLFDANKSGRFEPIRKVASGGELSRLMLCIKSLVAENIDMPTLIFDEIDTGISGEAAKQVGIIMKKLANDIQVIAITHQPQIAAKAHTHLYVFKEENEGAIKTSISILEPEKRIRAIAQMLGGENPSDAAIQNAKEMIEE